MQSSTPDGAGAQVDTRASVSVVSMGLVSFGPLHTDVLPERPAVRPWAYLITFSCYGTRLHGRVSGAVDPYHNAWRGRYLEVSRALRGYERSLMRSRAVRLTQAERQVVLAAIREVCRHEEWFLHAAHVRSNHVHIVVSARTEPEQVMKKLKAYSSRALNQQFGKKDKRWTRHGSTAWIWEALKVDSAVDYVVRRQGEPMAVYENPKRWEEFLHW